MFVVKRFVLIGVSLLLLTVSIFIGAAQDTEAPVLCGDDPVFTTLEGAEQIDDLTFRFENELGQVFIISFDTQDFEALENLIAEFRFCFEAASPSAADTQITSRSIQIGVLVIDDETYDYELEVTVIEERGEVSLTSNAPLGDILEQTFEDFTGIDAERLIEARNNGDEGTLADILQENGISIEEFIDEAVRRAFPEPDAINQLIAEMGYSSRAVNYGVLEQDAREVYATALEMPFYGALSEADTTPSLITVYIELVDARELSPEEPFVLYFAIDPSLGKGWGRSLAFTSNAGTVRVNGCTSRGSISYYLYGTGYVWSGSATASICRNSGYRSASTLYVVGWRDDNYFTLRGTWYRN